MARHNTEFDAANTAVRAFLTKLGEMHLGKKFNTGSGYGKALWEDIKAETFNNRCAYCGEDPSKLTMEHLTMFNRNQCGLHHPGNTVPVCSSCNKRGQNDGDYDDWETHLTNVIEAKSEGMDAFKRRKNRIKAHIRDQGYPDLTADEENAIRAIANSLYEGVKKELERSADLFKEIDKTMIRGRSSK